MNLKFTVTALGAVENVRLVKSDLDKSRVEEEVTTAVAQALRRSLYRPRVVGGAAVTTPDLTFGIEFCMDRDEIRPTCKGKGDVSAVAW
jgi:hypothetical protein